MDVALRVDDFGWSPKYKDKRDKGLKSAQAFHAALKGLPYLAAIIPQALDTDGIAWLQTKPAGMRVAMHGYDHANCEFRKMHLVDIRRQICRCRRIFKDVSWVDFVLPFNQYESGIAEACHAEGVQRIWGGGHHLETDPSRWPTPPAAYPLGNITFVPSWKPLYGALIWPSGTNERPLCEAMPNIMNMLGKAILTLHITWEAARGDDFAGVKWLVEKYGDRVIGLDKFIQ